MKKFNNIKPLGIHKDNILGVNYSLDIVESAKELSDELKAVLKKKDIDYTQYNTTGDYEGVADTPPSEIYEYQNFFVLQRKDGDLVLLDGFRRLLWYNAPSTPIIVRFYLESELTDQQILTLLVNLNHFKFFSDQQYHERGFSLLLKTVFDIDIMQMKSTFDAYLSSDETKNGYSSYGKLTKQSKNVEIKNRIVNKFFISDLRFLQAIQNERFLSDQHMGALVYEMRKKTDIEFDAAKFISLVKANKVLLELMDKYKKVGTDHSSRSIEIVNKIIEMYRNIFTLMEGGEVEKSFAEKQQEAKDVVEKLKKDKTLVKMTGSQQIRDIERELDRKIKAGEPLEFVCVIHPNIPRTDSWGKENNVHIPHGLFDGIKFLRYTKKHLDWMGNMDMNFGAVINGKEYLVRHNFGSGAKKYTTLDIPMGTHYDIDLFVRMEVEKPEKVKEPKQIKEFRYSPQGRGKRETFYVLAWTNKEAKELLNTVCGAYVTDNDMKNFVGKAWGTDVTEIFKDIDRTKSCAYSIAYDEFGKKENKASKLK